MSERNEIDSRTTAVPLPPGAVLYLRRWACSTDLTAQRDRLLEWVRANLGDQVPVEIIEDDDAGIPGEFDGHQPVLWDAQGYLRDPKLPTPGPTERLAEGFSDRVLQRYLYLGSLLAQRETYRLGSGDDVSLTKPEVTRFVPLVPGGAGLTAYVDADGRVDLSVPDRRGRPWFSYRACEGVGRTQGFTVSTQNEQPHGDKPAACNLRGTGLLRPVGLPGGEFLEYPPFHLRVLEADFLAGRRGLNGWNGLPYNPGLLLNGPPQQVSCWDRVVARWDEDPVATVKYVGVGAVLVFDGVLVTIATAGLGAPIAVLGMAAGGALAGFGMGFGITGAITGNFGQALQAGKIGAVAGAVAGGVGYGVGLRANAGLQWLVTSGRPLAQLGISTVSGAAAGTAAGGVGGFVSGTLSGIAEGRSWTDAASLGWVAAKTGALWGGVIGGAAGFLSGAIREMAYVRLKNSIIARAGEAEARGLRDTMRWLENAGIRVRGDLVYDKSGHGIDLWGKGIGRKAGVTAVAEAKAGSLEDLGYTSHGRQGGPSWVKFSAEAALRKDLPGAGDVVRALKANELEMYIGLAKDQKFGIVDLDVWLPSAEPMNFRQHQDAIKWLVGG